MIIPYRGTLKSAKTKGTTTAGVVTCLLKVPGTPGSGDDRFIVAGTGWFETPDHGDYAKIYVTDEDNILGDGAGTIVASYTDEDVPADNQGWYICKHSPMLKISTVTDGDSIPAGLYLKIIGTKGTGEDTLRVNIKWGKS